MNDLKHDLQSLADRHADQADGDFDSVLRTATSRRRRRVAGISAVACAVLAVGAIATLTPWQNDSAPAPVASKPTLDPKYRGTMTITPATAAPGAQIGLTYPEDYTRGVAFTLQEPDSGKILYYLTSGRGKAKPTWADASGGPRDTTDGVGIGGPGPDRLVVPDTAADGTYLLCTANAATRACALLTVAR